MAAEIRETILPVAVRMEPIVANPQFTVRCLNCGFAHDSPKGTNAEAEAEFNERHRCDNPQYSSSQTQRAVQEPLIKESTS